MVDLGCGTGVNLPALAHRVGVSGRVVGVALSPGMLARARGRVERHHLPQVTLVQADIRDVRLPDGTAAVLATASMEMVLEYDEVIRDLADQLAPPAEGSRWEVSDDHRPGPRGRSRSGAPPRRCSA